MTEALRELRVGFFGAGAMASALAGGLVAAGVGRDRICAGDPDAGCRKAFGEAVGAATHTHNDAVVADSVRVAPEGNASDARARGRGRGRGTRGTATTTTPTPRRSSTAKAKPRPPPSTAPPAHLPATATPGVFGLIGGLDSSEFFGGHGGGGRG